MDKPKPLVCGVCGHECYDTEWVVALTLKFGVVRELRFTHSSHLLRGYAVDYDADTAPAGVQDKYFEALLCEHCRDKIWDTIDERMPE